MRVSDLLNQTRKGLMMNKLRSALTILGIVIGIASVIAMTALINGVNVALVGQLGLDQAQLVYISLWSESLTYDDVAAMAQNLPDYEYITAVSWGNANISTGRTKKNANLVGMRGDYFVATKARFVDGEGITNLDDERQAMKVVLDQASVRLLYGDMNKKVVGEEVKIGNEKYKIVGVIETNAATGGEAQSVTVYIPFSTMVTRVTGDGTIGQIYGYVKQDHDIERAVLDTEDYLMKTYSVPEGEKDESMAVYSMQSMIDSMNATTNSFSVIMTSVASISLVVGGIGIMNMMLTNVTERIREIGLRKALGARRWDITSQFLLESICLCLVGGAIGIALGYCGSFTLTGIAGDLMLEEAEEGATAMEIVPTIDSETILVVVGICVAIGIIFGWYPAYRAAKMDPVESLHYQ